MTQPKTRQLHAVEALAHKRLSGKSEARVESGTRARVDSGLAAPIFVLGATRSGTTLLALMLGHHPDSAHASELEWVWDFKGGREPERLDDYHEWLLRNRSFRYYQMTLDTKLDFRELVRDLLRQMRDGKAGPDAHMKRELVCQMHRHYAQVYAAFPRSRFIHIVRDGRDVTASWLKHGWLGNGYEAGAQWKQSVDEWEAAKAVIPEAQRMEVRFEEVIADPRGKLREMCAFLRLEFDESMLQYHQSTAYKPVDSSQAHKWKKQLRMRDIRWFESVASAELIKSGYELSGIGVKDLTATERAQAFVEAKVRHHRARIDRYGVALWSKDLVGRTLKLHNLQKRAHIEMDEVENDRVREGDRRGAL